jgi:hypothetical protein
LLERLYAFLAAVVLGVWLSLSSPAPALGFATPAALVFSTVVALAVSRTRLSRAERYRQATDHRH